MLRSLRKLRLCVGLGLGAALFLARAAHAVPEFPPVVRDAAHLSCTPTCLLCHTRPLGGIGTANAFAKNLRSLSPIPLGKPQAVATAIQCARERNCPGHIGEFFDSDGDGTSDIEELDNGANPAIAGDVSLCGATYGCGARIEPRGVTGTKSALAFALGAGFVWLLVSRRTTVR